MIMDQMVGVISLEDLMVNHGMSAEGVLKTTKRAVHEKLMNGPFEE